MAGEKPVLSIAERSLPETTFCNVALAKIEKVEVVGEKFILSIAKGSLWAVGVRLLFVSHRKRKGFIQRKF